MVCIGSQYDTISSISCTAFKDILCTRCSLNGRVVILQLVITALGQFADRGRSFFDEVCICDRTVVIIIRAVLPFIRPVFLRIITIIHCFGEYSVADHCRNRSVHLNIALYKIIRHLFSSAVLIEVIVPEVLYNKVLDLRTGNQIVGDGGLVIRKVIPCADRSRLRADFIGLDMSRVCQSGRNAVDLNFLYPVIIRITLIIKGRELFEDLGLDAIEFIFILSSVLRIPCHLVFVNIYDDGGILACTVFLFGNAKGRREQNIRPVSRIVKLFSRLIA